jgi:hypothetical protein
MFHTGPEVMHVAHMPAADGANGRNGIEVEECILTMVITLLHNNLIIMVLFSQSARVCDGQLRLKDLNTEEPFNISQNSLTITENTITFTSHLVEANRHYFVTVDARNSAGTATSNATISKCIDGAFWYVRILSVGKELTGGVQDKKCMAYRQICT